MAAQDPRLNQLALRRAQLPRLGLLGIQSLGYIDSHAAPSTAWVEEQNTLLTAAAQHSELTDFVVLPQLQQLLEAASKH